MGITEADIRSPDSGYYSFALRAVMTYEGYASEALTAGANHLYMGDRALPVLSDRDGGYQNVDGSGHQILLRYHTDQMAFLPSLYRPLRH